MIKSICEAALNLLKGNIHLTDNQKQKLAKFKNTIRRLASKSNLSDKKKIIIQKGGFLEFLVPALISGITSLIGDFITKPLKNSE